MDTNLEHSLTNLPEGSLLRIDGGQGQAVAVFSGLVWITQDNDTRDVILQDGESFTLDRPGLAIVQALHDSSVLVIERCNPLPGLPLADSFELEARARQQRARALADSALRMAALPRLLWTRLTAPAASARH